MIRRLTSSRYYKIAVDLAVRIASGKIPEGERLKGRSRLSTEYNVSPETIRRAISILAESKVVVVKVGSGIEVASKKNAIAFVRNFREVEKITELRGHLAEMMEQKALLEEQISSLTTKIIDQYGYLRSNLIDPVEFLVAEDSPIIGKSIGELSIWQNTGVTVIGIVQYDDMLISPGPFYKFNPNDGVLVIGDDKSIKTFESFITEKKG
ncbi:MAG: GntR family transcriptional regulator [Clostridiales bacterium]|nr:GntR family transcriptional regulator [Clostridiales bacterium]